MWKSHATSHVSVKENVECWRTTVTLQCSLKMWVVSRYHLCFVLFPYPLHTIVLICLSSDSRDTKRSIRQLLDASTTLLGWGSSSTSGVGRVSVIRLYRIVQVRGLPEESRSRLLLSSLQSLITNVFVLLVQNLTKGPPWLIRQTNHDAAHHPMLPLDVCPPSDVPKPTTKPNCAIPLHPHCRQRDIHHHHPLSHSHQQQRDAAPAPTARRAPAARCAPATQRALAPRHAPVPRLPFPSTTT